MHEILIDKTTMLARGRFGYSTHQRRRHRPRSLGSLYSRLLAKVSQGWKDLILIDNLLRSVMLYLVVYNDNDERALMSELMRSQSLNLFC